MQTGRHVVITQTNIDQATLDYLAAHGCTVEQPALPAGCAESDLTDADLTAILSQASGWIVGQAWVRAGLLHSLPGLRVISRRGVGYDRVDTAAVQETGKVLAIAAGGNDASVADHALAMMLALLRRLRVDQARMQAGDWKILPPADLTGRTVGLIGCGRIGKSVARRLQGFDCTVLVQTPRPDHAWGAAAGVRFAGLDALLAESDLVSIHCPLRPETRNLIDAAALARMKRGALLLNTARGGIVDDRALLAALQAGHLGGAGLDVFGSEADPSLAEVTTALLARPDVVATPHSAASSIEGLALTNLIAAQSVVAVLDGGDPDQSRVVADGRRR